MRSAKQTLAIVALTTSLMSCSCVGTATPASTPTIPTENLLLYTTTATTRLALDLTLAYTETQPQINLESQSANFQASLNQIMNGTAPYFLTNHLPFDSPLWGAPIAQDGIALITNLNIPINNLSIEQLRLIYQGRIRSWSNFSNINNQPITIFTRENGSGTRSEFERLVMGSRLTTPNAIIATSSDNMLTRVINTPNSIGYISMSLILNTPAQFQINLLTINGIELTQQAVTDNSYPLRSTIYIVGLQEPTENYLTFIAWIQSQQGQAVVAQHYAPLINQP